MKNRKTKSMLLGLAMVASVASVGFASWIISQDSTKDVTGNIVADSVTDLSLGEVTLSWVKGASSHETDTEPSVVFGYDTNKADQLPTWLKNDKVGTKTSKLTVYLKINIEKMENLATSSPISVTVSAQGENTIDAKYIQLPTVSSVGTVNPDTSTGVEGDGFVIVPLEFKWGTAFGGDCPEDFFNGKADINGESGVTNTNAGITTGQGSDIVKNGDLAKHVLNEVEKEAAKGFKVTVTAKAKTTK